MIDPELGEKVNIGGVIYECAEPQQEGWMWEECDLCHDRATGCLDCGVLCNALYRVDGKHIILKRTSK